jgi:NAD(P)-dependent dehydrogenase (short-subunit alcohol dehydrogenase family)
MNMSDKNNFKEFDKKVVLVTGGSSGIGQACAEMFARAGASVVIAARQEAKAKRVIKEIHSWGGEATFIYAEVSQSKEVESLIDQTADRYGGLHYLVNNAGIEGTPFVKTADYQEDVWDQVISINLKGVWLCMKYGIPIILKSGGGAIVNVSSFAGLKASKTGGAAYTASKHGVVGMTKSTALEYAKDHLRVNCVCPAIIDTPNARNVLGKDIATAGQIHPMGRLGTSDEVANAVLWLCSNKASFITGISLPIDGGLQA